MANTSATGGVLTPSSTQGLPGGLTLEEFIHNLLAGLSEIPATLVRPKWQLNPPKYPALNVTWLAYSVITTTADFNAYVGMKADGTSDFQRQEELEIQCAFYGPLSSEKAALVRDGFQIQQNSEVLRAANMGYKSIDPARNIPDLVNEQWNRKIEQTIYLRRQIQRVYPVLSILSANGIIHTMLSGEEYDLPFQTPEET